MKVPKRKTVLRTARDVKAAIKSIGRGAAKAGDYIGGSVDKTIGRRGKLKQQNAKARAQNRASKGAYLTEKGKYRMSKAKAYDIKQRASRHKREVAASVTKSATRWAGISNIIGKAGSVGEKFAPTSAAQNVQGGLTNTSNGRNEDSNEDQYPGGGIVGVM